MKKTEVFKKELDYIKDPRLKEAASYLVDSLPDYFFEIPASSTGKYHPKYALEKGGLVRHTKAAVSFLQTLLGNPLYKDEFSQTAKDLLTIALIIHDGLKNDYDHQKYTAFNHPLLMARHLDKEKANINLDETELRFLKDAISSHMGPWNESDYSTEKLPLPETKAQHLIHVCDYLASRKHIEIMFDNNDDVDLG